MKVILEGTLINTGYQAGLILDTFKEKNGFLLSNDECEFFQNNFALLAKIEAYVPFSDHEQMIEKRTHD